MRHKTLQTFIIQTLKENHGRWMNTIDISNDMPSGIAAVPRGIGALLRRICEDAENGIERRIDPVTKKRYFRYTGTETAGSKK